MKKILKNKIKIKPPIKFEELKLENNLLRIAQFIFM